VKLTALHPVCFPSDSPSFPPQLRFYLGKRCPPVLAAIGNLDVLGTRKLALFCSVKCPGRIIVATSDLARSPRDVPLSVVGGFHSPMEKECLNILLSGRQPIVACLARQLRRIRIPGTWRDAVARGRLLILSAAEPNVRRPTVLVADERNRLAAALADKICITYAAPGGKTERFLNELLNWGKPVFTLDCPENAAILARGARPLSPRFHSFGPIA
jgi:predicted Rossmann fold nucleotide-binding protein DprA/Smf involved in DNA uptake